MRDLVDKVAVITGGASGIGLALATRAGELGMKVVIADIETDALAAAATGLRDHGVDVLDVVADVTSLASIEALRDAAVEAFGGVHVLCNNAGVGSGGRTWETPIEMWKWVIDVDLWGVIYGVHAFVPLMLEQGEGHIVNTASIAGLTTTPGLGPYNVAKHGVVTLSETMYHELAMTGKDVHVSVLCPAFVRTRIHESDRNAPDALTAQFEAAAEAAADGADAGAMRDLVKNLVESGLDPAEVAHQVFQAIEDNQFYVLTHPESVGWVKARMHGIIEGQRPASSFG